MIIRLTILVAILTMAGCVTETSGGLPGPAPVEERVQAQLDLARGYIENRDFARARKPLQKALEIDPNHVETHVLTAVFMHAENELELAEQHYEKALQLDPTNAQALNNYASFLYAQGRYEQAVSTLSRLVRDTNYRARSQAFENLGLAQLQLGSVADAEASFERALDLNFRQPRSSLELADIHYGRGAYASALNHYLSFRTYARQNARSLCLGIKLGQAVGDDDLAASSTLGLKNLFPDQVGRCQAKT